jgi:hypothetical protein
MSTNAWGADCSCLTAASPGPSRTCEHHRRRISLHSCSRKCAGSVVASSRADDQRVLLRASQLLHHVLACQRLPHRPERFLIHQPHRTPARGVLRATAAVVRPFARTGVSRIAGVQRAVRATDDVDEVHTPIVAGAAPSEMPAPEQNVLRVKQVVTVTWRQTPTRRKGDQSKMMSRGRGRRASSLVP